MKAPWPFGHLGLKVLSVGLAVMLWMVVSGEETVERGLRVPLEFQQFPAGLELQEEMPSTVDVRVRGGSSTLGRLLPTDIVAVLDMHGSKPGRRLFHLTADQVHVPFGVEVTQLNPPSIALVFEARGMRQVPVSPEVEGRPAPGFVVGKITSDPPMVDVIGPETAVGRVTEAITESVSVENAKEAIHESVSIGFVEPTVRLKAPRAANITVEIVPAPAERLLRGRAVHLRNLGANLTGQVVPSSVDVGLRGSRESLNRVPADDVSAYVDLAGLGAGDYALTVHADAPGEVGVTTITPMSVQVHISSVQK